MDAKVSKTIYIAKAFAVLSIICAHCGGVNEGSGYLNIVSSNILSSLGSIGVGIFLFLSGYLMFFTKKNAADFFTKKITSLVLPWFFCGTLVYLYVYLRKGGLGFISLVKWLLGIDTYLYYMTVLSVLYLVCFFIRKNKTAVWVTVLISAAWNIALGAALYIHPGMIKIVYLDPIRFAFFFALGLLVANYGVFENILAFCKKSVLPATAVLTVIIVLLAFNDKTLSYFRIYYIFVELVALAAILGISAASADTRSALFTNIGKASFSIYLLHMPIAGIVANVFRRIDFFALTLLRPIIVLVIVYFAIWALNRFFPKGKALNLINTLIGMR